MKTLFVGENRVKSSKYTVRHEAAVLSFSFEQDPLLERHSPCNNFPWLVANPVSLKPP